VLPEYCLISRTRLERLAESRFGTHPQKRKPVGIARHRPLLGRQGVEGVDEFAEAVVAHQVEAEGEAG
jgi:hypothetical protein